MCHECFFCYPVTIQANLAKLKKHICSVDTYQKFTTVTSKKKSLSMFSSLKAPNAVQMMRCSAEMHKKKLQSCQSSKGETNHTCCDLLSAKTD